ncbi:MAG TPA: zf-HC2 domain-containing protein, partial [Candidatus Acidoferrales bacterium]
MEKVPQIVSERLRTAAQTNHAAAADHLDADVLTAFAEKSLPEAERTPVMDHLARCGDCRDVLALALPASESLEPMAEPSRASFSHSSVSRSSWFSWPVLRWGFAAAGLAVIATFGVMQYQRSSRPETESMAKAAGPNAPAAQASNVAGPGALSSPTATTPVSKRRAAELSAGNRRKKAVDVPAPQVAGSLGQIQIGEPSMASSETAPRGMVRRVPTPRAALPGGNMGGTTASGTTTANAA